MKGVNVKRIVRNLMVMLMAFAVVFSPIQQAFAVTEEVQGTPDPNFNVVTDIKDGVYECNADDLYVEGAKMHPPKMTVKNIVVSKGRATATVVFNKKTYSKFRINFETRDTKNDNNSYLENAPVKIGEKMGVQGYSTLMDKWVGPFFMVIPKDKLVDNTADYTKVDEAIKKVPADLSKYTDDTVKALNTALAAVNRTKSKTAQAEVDKMASDIENAIGNLKEKPVKADTKLTPGIYKIEPRSDEDDPSTCGIDTGKSKMFRIMGGTVTIGVNGKPVSVDIYLSGQGYDALYSGEKMDQMPKGIITKENTNKLWTKAELPFSEAAVYQEGMLDGTSLYHFDFAVPENSIDEFIKIGGHSAKYDQWSHKEMKINGDRLTKISDLPELKVEIKTENINLDKGEAVFRVPNVEVSNFVSLKVDNKDVEKDEYTLTKGSIIISLKKAFLEKIGTGEHTISVETKKGVAETKFTVNGKAESNKTTAAAASTKTTTAGTPKTGDGNSLMVSMILLIIAALSITAVAKANKK